MSGPPGVNPDDDRSFEESGSDFGESGDEDDEMTLDEEEALDQPSDSDNELDILREEGELSVEELRRRYGVVETPASAVVDADMPGTSAETLRCSSRSQLLAQLLEEPDDSIDDNDDDYEPTGQFSRKICVGENYQVEELPMIAPSSESSHTADPLWAPSERCDEPTIVAYLKQCEQLRYESQGNSAPPKASTSTVDPPDDENALFALYQHDYDVKRAVADAPFGWAAMHSVNGPRLTYNEPWRHFSEEDCVLFEEGIRKHNKNFFLIQRNKLKDRTVGELVHFYYTWKKTERHDIFVRENTAELGNDPNATDFMGDIMNEMYDDEECLEAGVEDEDGFEDGFEDGVGEGEKEVGEFEDVGEEAEDGGADVDEGAEADTDELDGQ